MLKLIIPCMAFASLTLVASDLTFNTLACSNGGGSLLWGLWLGRRNLVTTLLKAGRFIRSPLVKVVTLKVLIPLRSALIPPVAKLYKLSNFPVILQSLGRMVARLSTPPSLGICKKLVYRLKVPGFSPGIPPSRVWEANRLPLLWQVITPPVMAVPTLVIRLNNGVEVAPKLMFIVPI